MFPFHVNGTRQFGSISMQNFCFFLYPRIFLRIPFLCCKWQVILRIFVYRSIFLCSCGDVENIWPMHLSVISNDLNNFIFKALRSHFLIPICDLSLLGIVILEEGFKFLIYFCWFVTYINFITFEFL